MKISFKVVDYSADRLVITKQEKSGKHQIKGNGRVVVRLFDESTVNRLVDVCNSQRSEKQTKIVRWWK